MAWSRLIRAMEPIDLIIITKHYLQHDELVLLFLCYYCHYGLLVRDAKFDWIL